MQIQSFRLPLFCFRKSRHNMDIKPGTGMEHGKNTPQRAALKDRIIRMARTAFAANGIKPVTMDEIAASLSISKRTLYEIFTDKETLLEECILQHVQEMERYANEVYNRSANVMEVMFAIFRKDLEDFRNTHRRFFEDIKKYPRVNELMQKRRRADSDKVVSFFLQGVAQGIFRADINFPVTLLLVREQFDVLLTSDLSSKYSYVEIYESIIFVYIRGISTEKGARMLDKFIEEYRRHRQAEAPGILAGAGTGKAEEAAIL